MGVAVVVVVLLDWAVRECVQGRQRCRDRVTLLLSEVVHPTQVRVTNNEV